MAKLRPVNVQIWADAYFRDLTPEGKLLFLYLAFFMQAVDGVAISEGMAEDTGMDLQTILKYVGDHTYLEQANSWRGRDDG